MMVKAKGRSKTGKKKTSKVRKKSKKETKYAGEPKDLLESMFEAITDVISIIDRDLKIIRANEWTAKAFNFKNTKELIGKKCYEVYQQKDEICDWCPCVKAFKTGKPQYNRVPGVDAQGNVTQWDLHAYPQFDKKGDVVSVIEYGRNVTVQAKLEEEVKVTKELLESMFNAITDGISVIDRDYTIIQINKGLAHYYGYKNPKDLIGKKCYAIFQNRKKRCKRCLAAKVFKTGKNQHTLDTRKDPHGNDMFLEVFSYPIYNEKGEATEVVEYSRNITKEKMLEEEVKASEENYSNLFQKSNDAIILHDFDGKIIDVNQRVLDFFGYSKKEVMALRIQELHPPEELKKSKKAFKSISKKGHVNFEIDFIDKNREIFPAEVSSSLFEIDGKKVVQGIIRDITERRKTEEQILLANERLQYLLSTTSAVIYTAKVSEDYGATFLSNNVSHLVGYKPEDFLKNSSFWIGHIHPDDIPRVNTEVQQLFKKGLHTYEYRFKCKDGTYIWVRDEMKLVKDEKGKPVEIVGFWADITKRRSVEDALRESEEKFRSLADQSPNMIFINMKGRVVYANEKCEEIMGYKKEDFYSSDFEFLTLIAPESKSLIKANFGKHMKGEDVPPYEYKLITKRGERIDAIYTTKLIKYGGENAILGIITDITERKKDEEKIKELKEFNESIVKKMSEGIMILDESGEISFINPKIEKMLGYSETELIGENWEEVFTPDYHRRMRDGYAENLRGESDRFEAVLYKKNRTELPVLISASPQMEEGMFKGILAVITDISDRKREDIAREELMKYKIKRGSTYLIKERGLEIGKEVVFELYKNHFNGLIITREHPDKIKKDIDIKLPLFWMTNDPKDKASVKPDFSLLEKIIDDNIDRNTFVLLDRFDYLVTQNSFKEALNFIQHLNEMFYERKAILIISFDPETLTAQELSLLEKETTELEKKREERLSADLLDLLVFVDRLNKVGESPSYKDVGDEFKITRTTARKRIKELIDKGLLLERKSGRFKYLVLTERGKYSL